MGRNILAALGACALWAGCAQPRPEPAPPANQEALDREEEQAQQAQWEQRAKEREAADNAWRARQEERHDKANAERVEENARIIAEDEEAWAKKDAEEKEREERERQTPPKPSPFDSIMGGGMAKCCDGTSSPSCACPGHRGCCSHHGGVCGCTN